VNPRVSNLLCRAIQTARRNPFFAQLAELEQSQAWSAERLRELQQRRLTAMLRHAAARVPYYRELLRAAGVDPAAPHSLDALPALPVLTKEDVRAAGDALVDELARPTSAQWTSGSTGEAMRVLGDQRSDAAGLTPKARGLGWHGITYGMRQAWVWRRFGSPRRQHLSHWLENHVVLPCHGVIDARAARDFHARCARFRPVLLFGNPSALVRFAHVLEDAGLDGRELGLAKILGSGEPLLAAQVAVLERVFGAPVIAEYGCTEFGIVAFPCEHGSPHWTAEHAILETLPGSTPGARRLVVTGLMNRVMPLIRYEVGDEIELGDGPCACGRALPVVRRVVGRSSATLRLEGGGRVAPAALSELAEAVLPIPGVRQIRFVQEAVGRVTVEMGTGSGAPVERAAATVAGTLERLSGGKLRADFHWTDDLAPEATGKRSLVRVRIGGGEADR